MGRYFTIILEKVRRLDRATLMLGKAHHKETKMLDSKSFFDFGLSSYKKGAVVHETVFSESAYYSKIISNMLKDVNNLNSIARPYKFDELKCDLLVCDNQVT